MIFLLLRFWPFLTIVHNFSPFFSLIDHFGPFWKFWPFLIIFFLIIFFDFLILNFHLQIAPGKCKTVLEQFHLAHQDLPWKSFYASLFVEQISQTNFWATFARIQNRGQIEGPVQCVHILLFKMGKWKCILLKNNRRTKLCLIVRPFSSVYFDFCYRKHVWRKRLERESRSSTWVEDKAVNQQVWRPGKLCPILQGTRGNHFP